MFQQTLWYKNVTIVSKFNLMIFVFHKLLLTDFGHSFPISTLQSTAQHTKAKNVRINQNERMAPSAKRPSANVFAYLWSSMIWTERDFFPHIICCFPSKEHRCLQSKCLTRKETTSNKQTFTRTAPGLVICRMRPTGISSASAFRFFGRPVYLQSPLLFFSFSPPLSASSACSAFLSSHTSIAAVFAHPEAGHAFDLSHLTLRSVWLISRLLKFVIVAVLFSSVFCWCPF